MSKEAQLPSNVFKKQDAYRTTDKQMDPPPGPPWNREWPEYDPTPNPNKVKRRPGQDC